LTGTAAAWPEGGLEEIGRCPICASTERAVLYSDVTDRASGCVPGRWTLWRCTSCRAAHLDPRPTPETIQLAYHRSYNTHAAPDPNAGRPNGAVSRFRRRLRNGYLNRRYGCRFHPASRLGVVAILFPPIRVKADRWVRHLSRPSNARAASLLDVGCGSGEFLLLMREAGWLVQGVDSDPTAAAVARRVSGAAVLAERFEDAPFVDCSFDAITLDHVIEHLHAPLESLQRCWRLLRPGGIVWVATPNLDAPGHRLFGEHWQALDPPRHLMVFTSGSLEQALRRCGFEIYARHRSCDAALTFRASAAIRDGPSPISQSLPAPPRRVRARAWAANFRALVSPQAGEELVIVARKPARTYALCRHLSFEAPNNGESQGAR
jgi:2-polyprenyl-3-methyl-5-hydroxy-6-metoxy-1,4-benzoquinol methylase